MAQAAIAIPIAMAVLSFASAKKEGDAVASASEASARNYEQTAGQERAAAQREMEEARRQGRYVSSAITARAAASGGGVNDPTVINLLGDAGKVAEIDARTAYYQREQSARNLEYAADVSRAQGAAAQEGAVLKGLTSALGAGSSLYGQFGGADAPNSLAGSYTRPNARLRGRSGTLGGGV